MKGKRSSGRMGFTEHPKSGDRQIGLIHCQALPFYVGL
jgi:hypothetical protein